MTNPKGAPRTPEEWAHIYTDHMQERGVTDLWGKYLTELFNQAMSAARSEGFQEGQREMRQEVYGKIEYYRSALAGQEGEGPKRARVVLCALHDDVRALSPTHEEKAGK